MKKAITLMAVAGLAAVASAELPQVRQLVPGVDFTLSYEANDDGTTGGNNPEMTMTGMSYDALAFVAPVSENNIAPGASLTEDYVSIQTDPDYLAIHRFVGGVAVAGESIEFRWFDGNNNFMGGYSVSLPSAGLTFVWTITINAASTLQVPKQGSMVMTNPVTNTGIANWRSKVAPPAIGTTTGVVFRTNMEVRDTPAPGALALLGLGGLAAARRRR
jgi:MYXO-CTERM domain-containing protein